VGSTCTSTNSGHVLRASLPRIWRVTPRLRASYETAMSEPFSLVPPAIHSALRSSWMPWLVCDRTHEPDLPSRKAELDAATRNFWVSRDHTTLGIRLQSHTNHNPMLFTALATT
jgi:hypothetical protein